MANYVAKIRSNYFLVKNEDTWQAFCDRYDLISIMTWDSDRKCNLYGFMDDRMGEGLPTQRLNEKTDEYIDIDFVEELSKHLKENEVAIIIEIGSTKISFLGGFAIAINSAGEQEQVSLQDIMPLAEKLGKNVTSPED